MLKFIRIFVVASLVIPMVQSCGSHATTKDDTLFTLLSPKYTGIRFINTIVEDEQHNHLINDMIVAGAGVAIGDINNDSLPDIFFAGNQVARSRRSRQHFR